jgi:hypothetical protein
VRRLSITDRYITVGGTTRSGVIPYMPEMSWLGDPPTEQQSQRYELKRAAIIADNRHNIEAQLETLARTFTETPKQRKRVNARLNELHAEKARLR